MKHINAFILNIFIINLVNTLVTVQWSDDNSFTIFRQQTISQIYTTNFTSPTTFNYTTNQTLVSTDMRVTYGVSDLEFNSSFTSFGYYINETNATIAWRTFQVILSSQTVIWAMVIDVMLTNCYIQELDFQQAQFQPIALSQGRGIRTQNVSLPINSSYFNGQNDVITGLVYPYRLQIININGSSFDFYWDYFYNRTHYTIQFQTANECIINYIYFHLLAISITVSEGNRYIRRFLVGRSFCYNSTADSCINTNYIVPSWTDSINTYFFGLSHFSINKNQSAYWGFNYWSNPMFTAALSTTAFLKSGINVFFIGYRSCTTSPNDYFDPSDYQCYSACSNVNTPYLDSTYNVCMKCHYSCTTCTGFNYNQCSGTCDAASNRSQSVASAPFECQCINGYIDRGVLQCSLCSIYIKGCYNCSDVDTCLTCKAGLTVGSDNKCKCINSSLTLTSSGDCINLTACINYYTLSNGTNVCTQCNYTSNFVLINYTCSCPAGYTFKYLVDGVTPFCNEDTEVCGNGKRTKSEQCDDGNLNPDDGCDQTCVVQHGFLCFADILQQSVCLSEKTSLSYIATMKIESQQSADLYFKIKPYNAHLADISSLVTYLKSSVKYTQNFISYSYSFHPRDSITELYFKLRFSYTQDVDPNFLHYMTLFISDSLHNFSLTIQFNVVGANLPLHMTEGHVGYQILNYFVLSLAIIAFVIVIISIFTENWIGIQLIQFFQFCFFYVFLISDIDNQIYEFLGYLKYCNGYNDIYEDITYFQYEKFNDKLYLMRYRRQILVNFNFMAFLFLIPLILVIIKLIYPFVINSQKKKKIIKKTNNENLRDKKDEQPWFLSSWFIIGRVFITITLAFSNEIIFNIFIEQNHFFAENLKFNKIILQAYSLFLILCVIAVISLLVISTQFVKTHHYESINGFQQDDQDEDAQFKLIKFQHFSPIYALGATSFQTLRMIVISVQYTVFFIDEIFLSLQVINLIIFLIFRPYKPQKKQQETQDYCYFLHNAHNIWNSFGLISILSITLFHNQQSMVDNPVLQFAIGYTVVIVCFISVVFALLRLFGSRKIAQIIRTFGQQKKQQQPKVEQLSTIERPLARQKSKRNKQSLIQDDKIQNSTSKKLQKPKSKKIKQKMSQYQKT